MHELFYALDRPLYWVEGPSALSLEPGPQRVLGVAPPLPIDRFGAASFRRDHGVRAAYVAGAMAGGIGSVELVAAMAEAGFLAGLGVGGLPLAAIAEALSALRLRLGPRQNFKVNLLHAPLSPALELKTVELFLEHQVPCISASGFLGLTPAVVLFRARGLHLLPDGSIEAPHRVMAKVSRPELAELFYRPAPEPLLRGLVESGHLNAAEAKLAETIPVAEDITAEGDSGGHTDRQPTQALWTALAEVRDRLQPQTARPLRLGWAGGVGTPEAVLAAFVSGADYVLTGSINQGTVEAGTSPLVKEMLAKADIGGVELAPAADMFELGAKVQVLKLGTLFAARGQRLARAYERYESVEALPAEERAQLEKQIFRQPLEAVWAETRAYLAAHAPELLEDAERSPKRRLAMIFRWYLGMSSRWAVTGEAARKVDFQIWCSSAMGAFNRWARNKRFAALSERRVADIAEALMTEAAALFRARSLALQGLPPQEIGA
ncbi:MAG: PfaD family polyunsaturated fatty acid/polyketide biosynthesis protein [Myxococcota bacterium]